MNTSKECKAVRNCILNELHLTKEDIIKNLVISVSDEWQEMGDKIIDKL